MSRSLDSASHSLHTSQKTPAASAQSEPLYRGKPEDILVVPRSALLEKELLFQGFTQELQAGNVTAVERLVRMHAQFEPRAQMEEDEQYKQIIPYFVFAHNKKLFLMQRSGSANESRLASKYTLGIGGHVRNEDLQGTIVDWGMREFHEEVCYSGAISVRPLGILNDDSNAVGRVHLGVVYLLEGDCDDIAIKSELQSGRLASLEECAKLYDRMEGWSQLVFDAIKDGRYF